MNENRPNMHLDEQEIRLRKKKGDLCPNCRARTPFHPSGSGRCGSCNIPLVAYDPPGYPAWITVIGLLFCFFYAFFGFLIADLSDITSSIPYFILVTAIFIVSFVIPHVVQKNRAAEYEISLQELAKASIKERDDDPVIKAERKRANLSSLAYYDDLFEIDHAFRSEGVMRERFLSGVCPPALPLRRAFTSIPAENTDSLGTLVESLYRYSALCGLHLSLKTVEELLMAMASTRLIYLEAADAETVAHTVKLLSGFFDCVSHRTPIEPLWKSTYDMLGVSVERSLEGTRTPGATGILLDLYCAKYNTEHLCVTLLEDVNDTFLYLCLDPFIKSLGTEVSNFTKNMQIRLKLGSNAIPLAHLDENATFSLPNNMWFFCTKAAAQTETDIPRPAHPVFSATVKIETEPNDAIINHFPCATKPISHVRFAFLCEEALEEHFLSEAVWQKCDIFFAFLEKELGVKIGNKDLLKIEDRSSLALAFFGAKEELAALDHALALCIGKKLGTACRGNEEKLSSLTRFADELFGKDTLSTLLSEAAV